jgi:hypothetical protein
LAAAFGGRLGNDANAIARAARNIIQALAIVFASFPS